MIHDHKFIIHHEKTYEMTVCDAIENVGRFTGTVDGYVILVRYHDLRAHERTGICLFVSVYYCICRTQNAKSSIYFIMLIFNLLRGWMTVFVSWMCRARSSTFWMSEKCVYVCACVQIKHTYIFNVINMTSDVSLIHRHASELGEMLVVIAHATAGSSPMQTIISINYTWSKICTLYTVQ